MDGITVSVCAKNVRDLVANNLPLVRKALPDAELLLIDGLSSDGTREAAAGIADRVISDEGRGLAYSRHLSIVHAHNPFVLIIGPDNQISEALAAHMREVLEADPELVGVSAMTKVIDAKNYWERTNAAFRDHFINRPGKAQVIGTPQMFKRDVLLSIPFDETMRASSDDTDLALRLHAAGYSLAIIDAYSYESQPLDCAAFLARWKWYGKGDAEFYAKHSPAWGLARKLRSLTHPLRTYALSGAWTLLRKGAMQYIPGMWLAVIARYYGWIRHARTLKTRAAR